jgi:transposase
MLVVETIAKVRRDRFVQGKSIRAIARERGLSRNTVRKVLRTGATAFVYDRRDQPQPKLGPFVVELERLLAANEKKAKRERLTLIQLFEQLQAAGYSGGYDAVRRHARRWRNGRRSHAGEVFIPLIFAPGEAYQFDWSHEIVVLAGATTRVKVAHIRLCHSRFFFLRAYPRESQEMVLDAHDRAFAFFGGACQRGIYDNMRTAVDAIFRGKERRFNRRFEQMCSHYLVEPVACTPGAGWEKGQVENQVGTARQRIFTPRLHFTDLEELNAHLLERCLAHAEAASHPDIRGKTIRAVFEAEKPALIPYAGTFDGFFESTASVTKSCLVRYDNNRYSVAAKAVGRPVQIQAYATRIVVRLDGEVVGEHRRCFGRGLTIYDPWHYVPTLARKPGALRNGAPFKDWTLPPGLARVQERLRRHPDGDRQFVDLLIAAMNDGLEAVETACQEALAAGLHGSEVILNLLGRRRQRSSQTPITPPEALRLGTVPVADCARYDRLRPGSEGIGHGAP